MSNGRDTRKNLTGFTARGWKPSAGASAPECPAGQVPYGVRYNLLYLAVRELRSVAVAHVAKYQSHALGRMCGHYERIAERMGYERPNIDPERTAGNYNLAPERDCGQVAFIQKRIDGLDLKRSPRTDAVRMCDCIVTMPRSLDQARQREFFSNVYKFLSDRYGGDNVVSAWVHVDETTPHMHFAWVPVTPDGRLSAKDVVNRQDLRTLHTDMKRYLDYTLGCDVEVLLGDERRGEKALSNVPQKDIDATRSALERKREDMRREIEELQRHKEHLQRRVAETERAIAAEELRIRGEEHAAETFQKGCSTGEIESDIRDYERISQGVRGRVEQLKIQIGNIRERVDETVAAIRAVLGREVRKVPRRICQRLREEVPARLEKIAAQEFQDEGRRGIAEEVVISSKRGITR